MSLPPPAPYAELQCRSNFSFLQGASHPQELIATAQQLGYRALAITDECSMAGVVRAYSELEKLKAEGSRLKLICGSFFRLADSTQQLVLLAPSKAAYSEICRLISTARLRTEKGQYRASLEDVLNHSQHTLCLWLPASTPLEIPQALKEHFRERLYIALNNRRGPLADARGVDCARNR